jgi:putative oxidoreductase
MVSVLRRFEPYAYLIMRVVVGLMFAAHGLQKLFGVLGGTQVVLLSRLGAAGVIEAAGGVLIALGGFTVPVAFVASAEMLAAYFLGHYPRPGRWPIQNGGELAVCYCVVFLYIATRGSGILSLDGLMRRR